MKKVQVMLAGKWVERILIAEVNGAAVCVYLGDEEHFKLGGELFTTSTYKSNQWRHIPETRELTHNEIFEALSKGALIRERFDCVNNYWSTGFDKKLHQICLSPDYTKDPSEWEWQKLTEREV